MSNDDQQNQPTPVAPAPESEAAPSNQPVHQGKQPNHNPNVRLRELLSIPERLRTDAQWDEIIDIEISIGPRKSQPHPRQQHPSSFRQNDHRGDRQEKKQGGGSGGSGGSGGGGGGGGVAGANKHMRKRNKNSGGQGRPPQGGGQQGGGQQGGRSGGE